MENGYKALRINLEDIKKFLKEVGGFDEIDSIYMGILINEKEKHSEKIGSLLKDKKYLTVQSNKDKTIDKLTILFYRYGYNYGYKCEPIMYTLLTLILCKGSEGELCLENSNSHTKIEVIEEKEAAKRNEFAFGNKIFEEKIFEEKEAAKKNGFAFGNIFFGDRIDHLIYTIFKNNKGFINFNDAQNKFEFLFCTKDLKGWHIGMPMLRYTNRNCDLTWYGCHVTGTEKIDECKIFIRHRNYENIFKRCNSSNDIDINALRKKGYVEIDLKENNDTTGFKYKLTDCNGRLISYAVDKQSETEHSRLKDYLNSRYEHSELKNFVERFNLGLYSGSFVLSDKAQGIYLTDYHVTSVYLVCLGDNTKLIFTKEFLDQLQKNRESSNKFYVLPKSQALQNILSFIAETELIPCKELFVINEKIVKSYDINKRIVDNIDEKCIPKLCIDDLIKVSKNDFECVFKVLKKVEDPSSNFEKNGIYEMLTQVKKNAEKEKKRKRSEAEKEAEKEKERKRSELERVVERLRESLKSHPNNQGIKTVYEKMKKKLEEEKNRYPNQEPQANYEK